MCGLRPLFKSFSGGKYRNYPLYIIHYQFVQQSDKSEFEEGTILSVNQSVITATGAHCLPALTNVGKLGIMHLFGKGDEEKSRSAKPFREPRLVRRGTAGSAEDGLGAEMSIGASSKNKLADGQQDVLEQMKMGKRQEYFVYFKVFTAHSCAKRTAVPVTSCFS